MEDTAYLMRGADQGENFPVSEWVGEPCFHFMASFAPYEPWPNPVRILIADRFELAPPHKTAMITKLYSCRA